VLQTAHLIDVAGSKGARDYIAAIKVFVPNAVLQVIDRAIQVRLRSVLFVVFTGG
jgi:acyl-CoA dehydrogenase